MDQTGFSNLLSLAGRTTATLVGIAYVAGFLVVAVDLSRYVVEFNPLRPHILSAGLLFAVMAAIPIYAAFNLFGFLGPERQSIPGARPVRHTGLLRVHTGITYYWLSVGMAVASTPILRPLSFPSERGFDLYLLLLVPSLAIMFLANFYFDKWWFVLLPMHALFAVGMVWVVFRHFGPRLAWLTVWYWIAGIATIYLFHMYKSAVWRGTVQWELAPFWLVGLVSLYTFAVYGNVRPWLGGGSPMPAILYFSAKPPISDSDSLAVKMLDESDSGYYVLLNGNPKNAYFIRRDLVMAVRYGEVQAPQQQTPAKTTP